MHLQVGCDFVAWVRETTIGVPRAWFILVVVVVTWLIIGLVVLGIYNLAN
jgi:hypothetical protein